MNVRVVVAGVGIWTTGPVPSAQRSTPHVERRLTHRDIVVDDPVLNSPLNRGNFSSASPTGHALLDRALYLPHEWTEDQSRRREAGVPDPIAFATKPQLAQRMLECAVQAGVPVAWVTGAELYGNDTDLRRWLEQAKQPYVMAVSSNHPLWHPGTQERADGLVAALPAARWGTRSCGAGSQGERW